MDLRWPERLQHLVCHASRAPGLGQKKLERRRAGRVAAVSVCWGCLDAVGPIGTSFSINGMRLLRSAAAAAACDPRRCAVCSQYTRRCLECAAGYGRAQSGLCEMTAPGASPIANDALLDDAAVLAARAPLLSTSSVAAPLPPPRQQCAVNLWEATGNVACDACRSCSSWCPQCNMSSVYV